MLKQKNILLRILFFSALLFACNKKKSVEKYYFAGAYPKRAFSSVKLFTLPRKISSYYNGYHDTTTFIPEGYGDKFIDSTGSPTTNKYRVYNLSDDQINRLAYFFVEQPCAEQLHVSKNCSPIYREAFVFYDAGGKAVAMAHICFDCELTAFTNSPEYMCDFDNKINYNLLASFINGIKYPQ